MKRHVFILNPAAANGRTYVSAEKRIKAACEEAGISGEIILTERPGHATDIVSGYDAGGDTVRFYACGGDGTLGEVATGIMRRKTGFENNELAMIPTGTGNDFPKSFEETSLFNDLSAQLNGEAHPIDLINYSLDGAEERIAVNIFNMGFDSDVVAQSERLRKLPLLGGPLSYKLGILVSLIKYPTTTLKAFFEDADGNKKEFQGKYLLTVLANGSHYGGGYKASPGSRLDDGLLNLTLVKMTDRLSFLSLVGKYKQGRAHETKVGARLITYCTLRTAHFISDKITTVCIDGELKRAREIIARVVNSAVLFSIPKRLTLPR